MFGLPGLRFFAVGVQTLRRLYPEGSADALLRGVGPARRGPERGFFCAGEAEGDGDWRW